MRAREAPAAEASAAAGFSAGSRRLPDGPVTGALPNLHGSQTPMELSRLHMLSAGSY